MALTLPVDQLRLRRQPRLQNTLELNVPCDSSDSMIAIQLLACLLATRGGDRTDGSAVCQPGGKHCEHGSFTLKHLHTLIW